uniref:Uncharacterized protein n=1 Tax=Ditylenchus dipsaci TaxID=166011 RepID=A0A915EA84_9BILA
MDYLSGITSNFRMAQGTYIIPGKETVGDDEEDIEDSEAAAHLHEIEKGDRAKVVNGVSVEQNENIGFVRWLRNASRQIEYFANNSILAVLEKALQWKAKSEFGGTSNLEPTKAHNCRKSSSKIELRQQIAKMKMDALSSYTKPTIDVISTGKEGISDAELLRLPNDRAHIWSHVLSSSRRRIC